MAAGALQPASDALALVGDEEDEDKESAKDEQQELRRKIREMQEEKRQREDYSKRLQRKLTKLNKSLADVVEEEEGLRRKQLHEQSKKEDESESNKRERNTRAANQEDRIREFLSDVLYTKPPSSRRKHFELDTVRVTSDRSMQPLAFRIDDGTTIMKLRSSACKYWNVAPDDFILKTMANNKCSDEILVKECFKQGELAQLRLEEKKLETAKPSEEELKAIMPKGKGGRKAKKTRPTYNAEGIEKAQMHSDNYSEDLRKMGGIYFLLKLRDMKPSEHCAKIKLRDIIIYTVLVALSIWVYELRRPSGQHYWLARGVEDAFLQRMPRPSITGEQYTTYVPGFREVQNHADLWAWLETTVPGTVWSSSDFSLGSYNMLVGFMSIRVKNVIASAPRDSCDEDIVALVERLEGTCDVPTLSDEYEDKSTWESIATYWDGVVAAEQIDPGDERIRGSANPGQWASEDKNYDDYGIGSLQGYIDTYNAAGYSAHYRMDVPNKTKAVLQYQQDVAKFKDELWISMRSRMVALSFTVYNHDYDMWLACDFMFEMPPSGSVKTYQTIRPFKPALDETQQELLETYIDYFRLVIAVYILIFVGMAERRHKIKYHKAGACYYFSLNGVTDMGIVICITIVVLWRAIGFGMKETSAVMDDASLKFLSFSSMAKSFETIFCVEGLIMVFLMYRMLSFFRLNHTIYILWNTLGNAFVTFAVFAIMFLPAILGFILVLHSRYGPYINEYSQISLTTLQMYKIVLGNVDISTLLSLDTVGAVIFVCVFYITVTFLLLNIFVTIVVDAYYVVHITAGGPGEKWPWQKYYKWMVPGLLVNLLQALLPSRGRGSTT